MANHKSAKKAIRSSEKKRLLNRYQTKTTRNMVKKLRETTDVAVAQELYRTVSSMLDKLAKRNIIHSNNAATAIKTGPVRQQDGGCLSSWLLESRE